MNTQAKPELDVDQHFNDIVLRHLAAEITSQIEEKDRRITVMLDLPYLAEYGKPTVIFPVYGCNFFVSIGDEVLCPPTPRGDGSWNVGIVVALDGSGYAGPVKYVRPIADKE